MPIHSYPPCPGCGRPLVRKPAGRCPECGAEVAAYVAEERDRETRIEKVVAVISTFLVVTVLVLGGGLGAIEGVLMYAASGAFVWYLAKGTFWSQRGRGTPESAANDEAPAWHAATGDDAGEVPAAPGGPGETQPRS